MSLQIALDLPHDVKSVTVTKNSPLHVRIKRRKQVNDLVEDGLLLCECTSCAEQFLMFSKIGSVICPSCGSKATKKWHKLKIGLVPER